MITFTLDQAWRAYKYYASDLFIVLLSTTNYYLKGQTHMNVIQRLQHSLPLSKAKEYYFSIVRS